MEATHTPETDQGEALDRIADSLARLVRIEAALFEEARETRRALDRLASWFAEAHGLD